MPLPLVRRVAPAPAPSAPPRPGPGAATGGPHPFVAGYAVVVLVLGTGAFAPLAQGGRVQTVVFALWACAYLVAAAGVFDSVFRRREPLRFPPVLLLYTALTALSTLWSVAPGLTGRRSLGLIGTVAVGVFLARELSALDLLDAVRRAVLVVAVSSLLLFASGSGLALDEVHGTLRGVLSTKNTLGRVLALGVLAAALLALLDHRRRRRAAVSGVLLLGTLPLTASTGGAVIALAAVLTAATVAVARQRRGASAVAAAAALSAAAACALLPSVSAADATGAIGEDATLTGRTDIWRQSLQALSQRPLLGHGYGAFWDEDAGAPAADLIRARLQWPVPNAHNGLLDVGLDLGVAGALLVLLLLAGTAARGVLDLHRGDAPAAALRLSVTAYTVIATLVETGLVQQNSTYTLLLAAAAALPGTRAARDLTGRAA
ncbi:O-antigen ligase family protein [Paenibacillus sp. TRM 82003]|uniref:O-antigen ligase family protein n=1 Tax=Kineococcus sp. TRM81007 TaxID=2925831 RepID=UPI001F56419C|nr:O-antigen ligase family protein [Kineococcus sp. TRM81007]MCI2238419.1 O-antigen ligase family protein [Kineococcus sp. TRM81007]MCI3922068.1 O-antigen ligase family protein [Paenibacillus sp. TRM 82003]